VANRSCSNFAARFTSASTVGELLRAGEEALSDSSSSARLDSEVLLGAILKLSRSGLLCALREPCTAEVAIEFSRLVERRHTGEPVAYITGEREFWGLSFKVTPAVLIPRPESELIVEQAVAFLAGRRTVRLLDLGTGSGALAISIVHELQKRGVRDVLCEAVDRSVEALCVAHENVRRHGLEQLITCVESDWCSNQAALRPPYDCIVANPPYIDPLEKTPVELSFEPHGALFSADSGLRDTAVILGQATNLVKPGGLLLIEVGAGKRGMLPALVNPYKENFSVSFIGDDSEADRFCVIRLQAAGE
jgi:release factor glutamine methyltransferase